MSLNIDIAQRNRFNAYILFLVKDDDRVKISEPIKSEFINRLAELKSQIDELDRVDNKAETELNLTRTLLIIYYLQQQELFPTNDTKLRANSNPI